jgi:hypothetical protein
MDDQKICEYCGTVGGVIFGEFILRNGETRNKWYCPQHKTQDSFIVYFTPLEKGTVLDEDGILCSPDGMFWPAPEFVYVDNDGLIWLGQKTIKE